MQEAGGNLPRIARSAGRVRSVVPIFPRCVRLPSTLTAWADVHPMFAGDATLFIFRRFDGIMTQPAPLRFGVLGTGRITRRMVAELQSTPGAAVTAIASRTIARARWQADSLGVASAVEGYDALLQRDDVDAVYLALPPSLHLPWTIAAAERGRHVLCEKPVSLTAGDSARMRQACRQHGVAFLDATAWMHHPRTAAFRQWLAEAEQPIVRQRDPGPVDDHAQANQFRLGTLRHVSASVSFLNPFQSDDHRLHASLGGGCLLDLGWYAVGAVTLATGGLPSTVHASAIWRGDIPIRVTAMMQFASDVSATISCGFDTATRKWFEIAGAEASIVCDDFTRPWPDKSARCWVHEASGKVHSFSFDGNQERLMIARFVDAAVSRDGRDSLEDLHEQMQRTQDILDAIDRSIRSGQSEACHQAEAQSLAPPDQAGPLGNERS